MSFLMEDNKLLKKDSKIWDKISNRIRKEFDSKSIIKNICKLKCNFLRQNQTYFHDSEIPGEGSHCISLSVMLIDYVLKRVKTIISKKRSKDILK